MRRLAILSATVAAAVALQSGTALANTVTFMLPGHTTRSGPHYQDWYVCNAAGQVSLANLVCIGASTECSWNFTFRSGAVVAVVRQPKMAAGARVCAQIVSGEGVYAQDRGVVDIYFLTRGRARFTFHISA